MKEILSDIKSKLLNHDYSNEEHVRLSLVARVLQKLEWDIWNPKEVNTEFVVVPSEDNKKVDIALFLRPFVPSVFIETKAVGQMQGNLPAIEMQMRNYNRDNQAMFTVITDGRIWCFYLSSASGEFSRRCFRTLDLLNDDLEQVEAALSAFLKRSAVENDNARHKAENYLKLNQIQRTAKGCLPEARRRITEPPFRSLPDALIALVQAKGFSITQDEAVKFIKEAAEPDVAASVRQVEAREEKPTRPVQVGDRGRIDFETILLDTLSELGGRGEIQLVLKHIENKLRSSGQLSSYWTDNDGTSTRWKHRVHAARFQLAKKRRISKSSPNGIWELVARGNR